MVSGWVEGQAAWLVCVSAEALDAWSVCSLAAEPDASWAYELAFASAEATVAASAYELAFASAEATVAASDCSSAEAPAALSVFASVELIASERPTGVPKGLMTVGATALEWGRELCRS